MTTDKRVEDMTIGELNLEYAKKDIWEAKPFTASFIERNTKTKDDAECILRVVAEHHKEVVDIFTQHTQSIMNELVDKQTIRDKAENATGEMLRSLKEGKLEKDEALEWYGYIRGVRDMVYDLNCQKNGESKTHDDLQEANNIIKEKLNN